MKPMITQIGRPLFLMGWVTHHRKLACGVALGAALMLADRARAMEIDDVMEGIELVESGGKDIGRHPDGVTFGRYGVTYMAVRELRRLRIIDDTDVDLMVPEANARIARLYLQHLKQRYGSWWEAVVHYNPRSRSYARRVWAAIDRQRRKVASLP